MVLPEMTLSVQKPKISTTRKKSGASAAKQHKTKVVKSEDLPDIELMPAKGEKGKVV